MSKKSPPDCIGEMACDCIGFRMRRLNRVISGYYDEGLRPHQVKLSQVNLLIVIERMQRVRPADLCQYARMDASTLSRNTDRMLERGWIKAVAGEDGRSHYLAITAEGRKMLKKIYPAWKKSQQKARALLGKELVSQLHNVEEKLLSVA